MKSLFSKPQNFKPQNKLLFPHKLAIGILFTLAILFLLRPQAYHVRYTDRETVDLSFLQKGDYLIEYSLSMAPAKASAEDACLQVSSEKTVDSNNQIGVVLAQKSLPADETLGSLNLHLDQNTYDLKIEILQNAEAKPIFSAIKIQSVQLLCTDHYMMCLLCVLSALFIAFLGIYQSPDAYKWPLLAVCFGLLASFPLANDFLLGSENTDISFHLARLESVYQGLRAGEFPVRIGSVQMNGFGSLSATMYPQLFLYPVALLRFFRVSVLLCYKLLIAGLNIGCSLMTYYALKNICKSEKIGILASFLYTFSIYRLVNIYQRGALGESLAMVFLPLVFWGIVEILWNDRKKWHLLALGTTGVLQSHVLSLEMCVIFLVAAVLCRCLQKDRKDLVSRLLSGIKAAVTTILLNASFLVPFLYFSREDLQCFHMPNELPDSLLYFNQMFFSFPHAEGTSKALGTLLGEMPLTVGGVLLLGMILCVAMLSDRREDSGASWEEKIALHCLVYGIAALLLTSWLFPWETLSKIPLVYTISCSLQFAWRFLGLASFFLCVASAIGIKLFADKKYGGTWIYACFALMVLLSAAYFFEMCSQELPQSNDKMAINGFFTTDSMYMYYDGASYKAHHLSPAYASPCMSSDLGQATFSNLQRKGSGLSVDVMPGGTSSDTLIFPIYYYPGYRVRVNGESVEGFCYNTLLACDMPSEPAHLEVRYTGPLLFRVADIVSILTLAAGMAYIFLFRRK